MVGVPESIGIGQVTPPEVENLRLPEKPSPLKGLRKRI
jgi:hypothetical protein